MNLGGELLGIVFTGGQGPDAQIVRRLLDEKAQKQGFEDALFIAADSGLTAAENAGIKPDWITGDMDSLEDKSRLDVYDPHRVIRHKHDKDFTDTELAFSLAVQKGCDGIWIIGGGGGRIDHIFAVQSLLERDPFPLRWITDNADIRCIDANTMGSECLTVNVEQNTVVSVFPLGLGPWKAKSCGLKWPLDGVLWSRGFFGLSNAASEGEFSVKAELGRFMVILPLGL
jgi:thiamine pyrophosphokinase